MFKKYKNAIFLQKKKKLIFFESLKKMGNKAVERGGRERGREINREGEATKVSVSWTLLM